MQGHCNLWLCEAVAQIRNDLPPQGHVLSILSLACSTALKVIELWWGRAWLGSRSLGAGLWRLGHPWLDLFSASWLVATWWEATGASSQEQRLCHSCHFLCCHRLNALWNCVTGGACDLWVVAGIVLICQVCLLARKATNVSESCLDNS